MAKTKEVKDIMKKARTTSVPGALHAFSSELVCVCVCSRAYG